jgi:hypothetical protein
MRTNPALLALTILLAACTATGAEPPATTPPVAGVGKCNSDALASYVGQKVTAALGTELLAKSGARTLRWGPPGAMMTMDYREDRLTVSYDEQMVITRLSCG